MTIKERFQGFIDYFLVNAPNAETELQYNSPFELLVAVILSAQCTDKRVNMTTPNIFEQYPNAVSMSTASFESIFDLIKSISFPNNKAKHLIGMAKMLVKDYDSIVPSDVDELQKMPGVGRKTANVIASVVYNQPTMAVDTHVFRVSKRIGLATQGGKTPLAVELQLMRHIPKHLVHVAHHWLILHGRYVCVARNPKCNICGISHVCKYFEKNILQTVHQ
jgi:endonuclease-3